MLTLTYWRPAPRHGRGLVEWRCRIKKNKSTLSVKRCYKIICLIFFPQHLGVPPRSFFSFLFPLKHLFVRAMDIWYSLPGRFKHHVRINIHICMRVYFLLSLSLSRLWLYYVIIIRTPDGGVNAYLNGRVRRAGYKFKRSSVRRGQVYRIPIE